MCTAERSVGSSIMHDVFRQHRKLASAQLMDKASLYYYLLPLQEAADVMDIR